MKFFVKSGEKRRLTIIYYNNDHTQFLRIFTSSLVSSFTDFSVFSAACAAGAVAQHWQFQRLRE